MKPGADERRQAKLASTSVTGSWRMMSDERNRFYAVHVMHVRYFVNREWEVTKRVAKIA